MTPPEEMLMLKEAVDRLRRLETRFTKYLQWRGFDTHTALPRWTVSGERGILSIPAMSCSLKDCLAAIPPDWNLDVEIQLKGGVVCGLYMKDEEQVEYEDT